MTILLKVGGVFTVRIVVPYLQINFFSFLRRRRFRERLLLEARNDFLRLTLLAAEQYLGVSIYFTSKTML